MADYQTFWSYFLKKADKVIPLYQDVKPTIKHYLHTKKGSLGPFCTTFNTKKSIAHVEICFQETTEKSKRKYDQLHAHKESVERNFGEKLDWGTPGVAEKIRKKIMTCPVSFNYNDESTWDYTIDSLLEIMSRFIPAIEQLSPGVSNLGASSHQRQTTGTCLPGKNDIETARHQMPHGVRGVDAVLDQVEKNILADGKILQDNWRMITERNIAIWFK